MNKMSYKGYHARIEYDADDEILVGHIAGLQDVVGFHADNVADLTRAFHEAVDDYLETCSAIGKAPEREASGRILLRVSPRAHSRALIAASLTGVSLNQFGEDAIIAAAEKVMA